MQQPKVPSVAPHEAPHEACNLAARSEGIKRPELSNRVYSSDGRCLTAGMEPCGATKCRTDCIRGPVEYQSLREPDAIMCLRKYASINKVQYSL